MEEFVLAAIGKSCLPGPGVKKQLIPSPLGAKVEPKHHAKHQREQTRKLRQLPLVQRVALVKLKHKLVVDLGPVLKHVVKEKQPPHAHQGESSRRIAVNTRPPPFASLHRGFL